MNVSSTSCRTFFMSSTDNMYVALRLHPVIPIGGRQARRDTVLPHGGGADGESPLLVPKGTIVMFNVYAMHRDDKVFGANVEAFSPERWENLRPGWAYLPFSGGPRICMGRKYTQQSLHERYRHETDGAHSQSTLHSLSCSMFWSGWRKASRQSTGWVTVTGWSSTRWRRRAGEAFT